MEVVVVVVVVVANEGEVQALVVSTVVCTKYKGGIFLVEVRKKRKLIQRKRRVWCNQRAILAGAGAGEVCSAALLNLKLKLRVFGKVSRVLAKWHFLGHLAAAAAAANGRCLIVG